MIYTSTLRQGRREPEVYPGGLGKSFYHETSTMVVVVLVWTTEHSIVTTFSSHENHLV